MAWVRTPKAVRRKRGRARLGVVPRYRRASERCFEEKHPARTDCTARRHVPARAPQPLSRTLAISWGRLSRLVATVVQPTAGSLERRPGAREGVDGGSPCQAG